MNVTLEKNAFTTSFTSRSGDFAGMTIVISQDIYDNTVCCRISFGPMFIELGGKGMPRTYIKSAFLECFYLHMMDDAETILDNLFEAIDLAEAVQGHD
jgi:hypothetical protein